jgi:hypothetical protein
MSLPFQIVLSCFLSSSFQCFSSWNFHASQKQLGLLKGVLIFCKTQKRGILIGEVEK